MATAQEANIARRAAVEEVGRLLHYPEDLKRLPSLREEYARKQQMNKMQLSAAVTAQVEATRAGLDMLSRAHAALLRLRENFARIDQLCAECEQLVDCHDKIQLLSMVHYNLRKTLQDVEAIAALPVEAAEAEEMLQNDTNLLQVYECLALLEGTSLKAQAAIESGTQVNLREAQSLGTYFQRVKQTMGRFEERLWSIVRGFLLVSRRNPRLLVTALRVVEAQEGVDARLVAAGQGSSPLRKFWRRRCLLQVGNAVQDGVAPLLARCSQLVAAGSNTDQRVTEILAEADGFVAQLAEVYDYVVPCFPPHYAIFDTVWGHYHRQLGSMIDFVGLCVDNLANSDILKVVSWVSAYQDALAGLGVDDERIAFPEGANSGSAMLMGKYVARMAEKLHTWLLNLVEGDFGAEPRVSAEGRPWTPGAVDFFRMLNEQVLAVADGCGGLLLLHVAEAAVRTMEDFQDAQRSKLGGGALPLESLCAVVNNNVRCYEESLEFADYLDGALDNAYKGRLDVEYACRGFLELSKAGVAACVAAAFGDPGLTDLFGRMGVAGDEGWVSGRLLAGLIATLDDFRADFERMLEPGFYRRLVEALLEECTANYVAALVCNLRLANDDVLARVRADEAALRAYFGGLAKPNKVARECASITGVVDFLDSDSPEAFVLSYSALLASAPGIGPALVASLLAARAAGDKNITRADQREILEQCREVYAERAGRTAVATDTAAEASVQQMAAATAAAAAAKGGGRAPSAREAAFRAAVSAARKRSNVVPAAAPAWPEAPQTAAPQSAAQSPMAGLSLGVVTKKTG